MGGSLQVKGSDLSPSAAAVVLQLWEVHPHLIKNNGSLGVTLNQQWEQRGLGTWALSPKKTPAEGGRGPELSSSGVPWRSSSQDFTSQCRVRIGSLAGEPTSHMLHGRKATTQTTEAICNKFKKDLKNGPDKKKPHCVLLKGMYIQLNLWPEPFHRWE